MKIAVIGYSGSGKSTLAKRMGELYGCPVLHLDTVQFEENWKERDKEQAKEIVKKFLENPCWVVDGNYRRFFHERRMEEADRIIFLNFNRFACFRRARRRAKKYKNKVREDMAAGCKEKFDYEFKKWILFDGRTKEKRQHYKNIALKYPDKFVMLKNQRQLDAFLHAQTAEAENQKIEH